MENHGYAHRQDYCVGMSSPSIGNDVGKNDQITAINNQTKEQDMSQWNLTTLPTEADADEFEDILVMYENGQKAVYNWEDYIEGGMQDEGCAWMRLPQ